MILFERDMLSEIMVGCTHYLDVGGRKPASVYYPSDTKVHMRTPDSELMTGEVKINDIGYRVNWSAGPSSHVNIAEHQGAYVYIDAEGKLAGTITKIVAGNPELL